MGSPAIAPPSPAEPAVEPLLDGAVGRFPARRIVAIAGREIGDAGPAATVDPQAGAKAVGIPRMADDRGAVAENIVPASGIRHRQALAGKAGGAIEAVAGIAIGPIQAPGRPPALVEGGPRSDRSRAGQG